MTAAPMHLCAFSHSGELGGAELCLAELVESMTGRFGVRFTVVVPDVGPLQTRVERAGAAIVVADLPWWCWDPERPDPRPTDAELTAGLLRIGAPLPELVADPPDVVVTSTVTIPWGAVAAVQLDRPHVWWAHEYGRRDHGFDFLLGYQESLRFMADTSHHIVATSYAVRDELFPDLSPEACSVATYVLDTGLPVGVASPSFMRPDALKLLLVGRVVETKGQLDAVRAVKRLVDAGQDVELCIAGHADPDAEYAAVVMGLVEDADLRAHVHLLGSVREATALMTQADVGLMCSRCEAFGRVTAEAMLAGRPVIGTDCGGTAELVTDGVDGFLYPPGDDAALAERIGYFLEHRDAVGEFGGRAREAMTRRVADTAVDDRMLDVCRGLSGRPGKPSATLLPLAVAWAARAGDVWEDAVRRRTDEVEELAARVASLERLIDERTAWAQGLDEERLAMRDTVAWRAHSAAVRLKNALRERQGR